MYNIIITSCGGRLSPKMIDFLRNSSKHKVNVIAVDNDKDASGKYNANYFEQVPLGTSKEYADCILNLANKYDVNLVIPFSDEEVISLANKKENFIKNEIVLTVPEKDILEILVDKSKTYLKLEELGILTPKWKLLDNPEFLLDSIDEFLNEHDTCVIKPIKGRGGRGIYIISNNNKALDQKDDARDKVVSLENFKKNFYLESINNFPLIIMETLSGPGYDIDILCKKGILYSAVPRRRFIKSGTPFKGSLICWPDEILQLSKKITSSLKLNWLLDIDLMTDDNGNLQLTEINPRPSGGIVSSIAAGIPLLDDLISLAKGEKIYPIKKTKEELAVVPYTNLRIIDPKFSPTGI